VNQLPETEAPGVPWGYPSRMDYFMENPSMDDNWGYPHDKTETSGFYTMRDMEISDVKWDTILLGLIITTTTNNNNSNNNNDDDRTLLIGSIWGISHTFSGTGCWYQLVGGSCGIRIMKILLGDIEIAGNSYL